MTYNIREEEEGRPNNGKLKATDITGAIQRRRQHGKVGNCTSISSILGGGGRIAGSGGSRQREPITDPLAASLAEVIPHDQNSHNILVSTIKTRQRENIIFKHHWQEFCKKYGGGSLDPLRYDTACLVYALQHCEKLTKECAAVPHAATAATLVDAIKRAQRDCPKFRERWSEYCAIHGDGIHDPSSHDLMFLKDAIETLGELNGEVTEQPQSLSQREQVIQQIKQMQQQQQQQHQQEQVLQQIQQLQQSQEPRQPSLQQQVLQHLQQVQQQQQPLQGVEVLQQQQQQQQQQEQQQGIEILQQQLIQQLQQVQQPQPHEQQLPPPQAPRLPPQDPTLGTIASLLSQRYSPY